MQQSATPYNQAMANEAGRHASTPACSPLTYAWPGLTGGPGHGRLFAHGCRGRERRHAGNTLQPCTPAASAWPVRGIVQVWTDEDHLAELLSEATEIQDA